MVIVSTIIYVFMPHVSRVYSGLKLTFVKDSVLLYIPKTVWVLLFLNMFQLYHMFYVHVLKNIVNKYRRAHFGLSLKLLSKFEILFGNFICICPDVPTKSRLLNKITHFWAHYHIKMKIISSISFLHLFTTTPTSPDNCIISV